MWKWNNIQWVGFISIVGGVVGALIAILINNTNFFYRESLDTKYCYLYQSDTMRFVLMAKNMNEAMEVRTFYVDSSVKSVSVTSKGYAPYRPKSDVLKYSKDSLFVKIRVKVSGVRGGTDGCQPLLYMTPYLIGIMKGNEELTANNNIEMLLKPKN